MENCSFPAAVNRYGATKNSWCCLPTSINHPGVPSGANGAKFQTKSDRNDRNNGNYTSKKRLGKKRDICQYANLINVSQQKQWKTTTRRGRESGRRREIDREGEGEGEKQRQRGKARQKRTESITLNLHNLFINWLPSKAISMTWQAKEAPAHCPSPIAHWQNAHRCRAHSPPQHVLLLSAQVEIKLCGSQTSWKRAEGIVWKSAKCRPKVDNAEWPLKPAPCPVPRAPCPEPRYCCCFSSLLLCSASLASSSSVP